MTETEKKALALVNEACKSDFKDLGITYRNNILDALFLSIEQHETDITDLQAEYDEVCKLFEAYKQEVSDALEKRGFYIDDRDLGRFIIAKPDPLVEAIREMGLADATYEDADRLRAALAKRGIQVPEKRHD